LALTGSGIGYVLGMGLFTFVMNRQG